MRVEAWFYASIGLANAFALTPRDVQNAAAQQAGAQAATAQSANAAAAFRPITKKPEFFSLKVDDKCQTDENPDDCPFDGYAIRLEDNIVKAVPYNKWYDEKLPIFFVDDDTKCYTVSKKPLQLYVNTITGALKFAPIGWLPPNSVAMSFYKIGDNPEGLVDPSPAYFSWPTTEGRAKSFASVWWLCPLGTSQYQVYISDANWGDVVQGGVQKDTGACRSMSLAAINANPYSKRNMLI